MRPFLFWVRFVAVHMFLLSWILPLPVILYVFLQDPLKGIYLFLIGCIPMPKSPLYQSIISMLKPWRYFKATIEMKSQIKEHQLLCFHPHGIFTNGVTWNFRLRSEFQYIGVMMSWKLRYMPFMRWHFDLLGGNRFHDISRETMKKQMSQGKTLSMLPGGYDEASLCKMGEERIFIRDRKGFIKYALQFGYDIRPV